MPDFINYNGELLPSDQPIVSADNRGLKFGDGIFETMRVVNGKIPLWNFHKERFFASLRQLNFELPGQDKVYDEVQKLCKKNATIDSARVRLMAVRGNGGLNDLENNNTNLIIQSWNIESRSEMINEKGLVIDVYPDARKSCDKFSNLKSNNFLSYVMATKYAKDHQFDDCLILNSNERIADSTIANVFIVKKSVISTPPLSEGCVGGVMRRFLINVDLNIKEKALTADDLLEADEVFLSNAVQGIRWVKQFKNKSYSNKKSKEVYELVREIFS